MEINNIKKVEIVDMSLSREDINEIQNALFFITMKEENFYGGEGDFEMSCSLLKDFNKVISELDNIDSPKKRVYKSKRHLSDKLKKEIRKDYKENYRPIEYEVGITKVYENLATKYDISVSSVRRVIKNVRR